MARQAERMGLEVLDRFVVAQDGWGSLNDPLLPRGGNPLALLDPDEPRRRRPDPLAPVERAPRPQRESFSRHRDAWWRRSDGPVATLHGVGLAGGTASPEPGWMGSPPTASPMDRFRYGIDLDDLVDLIEGILDPHGEDDDRPCPCRSLLASIVERQGMIAMLLAQIGWGEAFGREVWTAFADPRHRRRSHERMLAALGGRFRRPDLERIEIAIGALLEIRSYSPSPTILAGVDEALAWLHWARGASSTAARLAERSLDTHRDRDLAPIVLARADRGMLPGWAFRQDGGARDEYRALLAQPERAAG